MRMTLLAIIGLLLVTGCTNTPTPPTPTTAQAVTNAQATLAAHFPTVPPAEATRAAVYAADAAVLLQSVRSRDPATWTPAAATHAALVATLTALPATARVTP